MPEFPRVRFSINISIINEIQLEVEIWSYNTLVVQVYFTTLYFKTTVDYKTTQCVPKVPLCVLSDFILRPPAIQDHIFLVPWMVLK